jgi:hypothetical protein
VDIKLLFSLLSSAPNEFGSKFKFLSSTIIYLRLQPMMTVSTHFYYAETTTCPVPSLSLPPFTNLKSLSLSLPYTTPIYIHHHHTRHRYYRAVPKRDKITTFSSIQELLLTVARIFRMVLHSLP